jgi:hypothetical protein
MASVQEKLAESLSVLKDYQDSHGNMIITQLSQVNKSETYRCIKIAKGFRKSRKISIFVVSTNKVPNTFSYAQRYINFLRTTRNFPAK